MPLREIKMDRSREYSVQCAECSVICMETFHYCLRKGGDHREPAHLQLLLDCSRMCNATSEFLATDSFYRTELAMICSEICDACALDCEQFEDDEQMHACAQACQALAVSCRRVSMELAA
jgi:hypothetical protein